MAAISKFVSQGWRFGVDVGGTFTDLVAISPTGKLQTHKTLSSGRVKGRSEKNLGSKTFFDSLRLTDPPHVWTGYQIRWSQFDGLHDRLLEFESTIVDSSTAGELEIADPLPGWTLQAAYEIFSDEAAPVVGIRYLLGLSREQIIPPVHVRLGTTRGTNALLERRGAPCALLITAGFEDALAIGNQSRPRLFELAIEKPQPLSTVVVGIQERMTAEGQSLQAPEREQVIAQLQQLKEQGIDSLAICLLHAYQYPQHEQLLETWAQAVGFSEISVSHRVSPLIKLISRADTTLVNAYLNPVLQNYLAAIQRSLAGSPLKVMTSAGGLVSAQEFQGKDSLLSGPAGGVVGVSEVAAASGLARAIGFDMGGTSTDVSRYEGCFEYEYETIKAGVRIATPLLAIETVAAGGGSICRFDGVRLLVGPESAGADPGPCCYGKQGPLTVTDMNVVTGRVLSAHFPFPLDVAAVEQKLQFLCEEIRQSPLGLDMSIWELAEGFLEIANVRMARAIRNVSTAKGFDPSEYALIPFGGAGGQHACALARELGINQILIHPLAGVLSAYGISQAKIQHHAQCSILKRTDEILQAELVAIFQQLKDQVAAKLTADGVSAADQLPPRYALDLRYVGRESSLTISDEPDADYRLLYEQEHHRRFGFRQAGHPVEVVAARIEMSGLESSSYYHQETGRKQHGENAEAERKSVSLQSAPVRLLGKEQQAEVWQRAQLSQCQRISGPAIICEPTSTILIEPGFAAEVLPSGALMIERLNEHKQPAQVVRESFSETESDTVATPINPVELEVFHNHFASIAEQMGETLRQTAHSVNVKERLDYSCAVFDEQGKLVANAPHIPVHLGAMGETVRWILQQNPHMQAGDVFVSNDPYQGGSHLPDITVVTPLVSAESGQPELIVASRAHHAEVGGRTPGSMPPFSRNLAEEGVVIRNFALCQNGVERFSELKALLTSGPWPSRAVSDNLADLQAQMAANQLGIHRLQQLISKYSLAVVQRQMAAIRQASAQKTRLALQQLPTGVSRFVDHLDDGSPISVTITLQAGQALFDFSGSGPVLPTNLNANRAIVTAAVMYVVRCLIAEDTPLNAGLLEPIQIVLPECLLNPPAHDDPSQCAAMVGGNVETSQRIVDVLLGALKLAAASQGTMNNLTFGNSHFGYYETICGGSGATSTAAGADAVQTHMTNTRLTDIEILERRYPVRLRKFAIRLHSGGAGAYNGGNGIVRELEFLEPLQVSMLSQRREKFLPYGLEGGEPGQTGQNCLIRKNASSTVPKLIEEDLGGSFQTQVFAGDVLIIATPGGGGFGNPSN